MKGFLYIFFPSGVLFYVGVQRSSSVVLLPDPAAGKYAHLWVSGKAVVDETSAASKMSVSVCVCVCMSDVGTLPWHPVQVTYLF